MAILNSDHLLDQAVRLAAPPAIGRPRQVDLRRAVSSAYYAVFHLVLTAAGDEFLGVAARPSREYALVVRSVDHATIKTACVELGKATTPARYAAYVPAGGFGLAAQAFIAGFPDLQEARHAADYDTLRRYTLSTARGIVATAIAAVASWRAIPPAERRALLFLLLFPPRR